MPQFKGAFIYMLLVLYLPDIFSQNVPKQTLNSKYKFNTFCTDSYHSMAIEGTVKECLQGARG